MNPYRIMLFSPLAAAMERQLMTDSHYHVLHAVNGEADVYALLMAGKPDIAVLDDHLPGINALHLLRRLKETCAAPPYCVYVGTDEKEALALGADGATDKIDAENFLLLVENACAHPLPGLAREAAKLAAIHAREMLQTLSFPAHLKGTEYLQYALSLIACHPSPGRLLGKPLYSLMAKAFSTTPAAAERALRTAIEATWLTGNLAAMADLFGYTVSPEKGKPTNNECLAQLARHVHAKTQHSLLSSP